MSEEAESTLTIQILDEEDEEPPAVETISISEEHEKVLPADYIILCRGDRGQVVRYKTHKQALIYGSLFFRNMFTTCGEKANDTSSEESVLKELELGEPASILLILLRSMYSEGTTIQRKIDDCYCDVSDELYSR